MSKYIIEPWHCDSKQVHVYHENWKGYHNGTFACVVHDLTIDQVKEIIKLLKWDECQLKSCEQLRDVCREVQHCLKDNPISKIQIGNLGFPVSELTEIEVAWLTAKAIECRREQASYAINPFIDRIEFDTDDLWLRMAEWFEERFPGEYTRDT